MRLRKIYTKKMNHFVSLPSWTCKDTSDQIWMLREKKKQTSRCPPFQGSIPFDTWKRRRSSVHVMLLLLRSGLTLWESSSWSEGENLSNNKNYRSKMKLPREIKDYKTTWWSFHILSPPIESFALYLCRYNQSSRGRKIDQGHRRRQENREGKRINSFFLFSLSSPSYGNSNTCKNTTERHLFLVS